MNIGTAFPSKFLKADEMTGDLTLTITRVEIQSVGNGDDEEDKPVAFFRETAKGLVLNKINSSTIAQLYGQETDGWTGRQITLFATEVSFGGRQVLGLRVRMKPPTGRALAHPPVQQTPPPIARAGAAAADGPTAAMNRAKQAYAAAYPRMPREELSKTWAGAVGLYFGSKPVEQLMAQDWDKFVAAGFVRPAFDDVIPAGEAFAPDEIPF